MFARIFSRKIAVSALNSSKMEVKTPGMITGLLKYSNRKLDDFVVDKRGSKDYIIEINDLDQFEYEVMSSKIPVVLTFTAKCE
jgi:hypothetical protein